MSEARHALNLSRRHWVRPFGDVTAYGTWWLHDRRPCMVMVPSFRPLHYDRTRPCVIMMEDAWMWDEHIGDGAHVARQSAIFAEFLFGTTSVRNVFRVTDIVRECLTDLLRMPPMPQFDRAIVADAVILEHETGKVREAEIKDDV